MRKVMMAFVGIGIVMASGCSTMPSPHGRVVVDSERVQRVEAMARLRGVEVVWVHLPSTREAEPKVSPKNLAGN